MTDIARAAGVSVRVVRRLIAAGGLATLDGAFVDAGAAAQAVRQLRDRPVRFLRPVFGGALLDRTVDADRSGLLSAAGSTALHGGALLAAAIVVSILRPTAAIDAAPPPPPAAGPRLIFVADPRPGGGGGGGGLRQPRPPSQAERRGEDPISSPVPPRVQPIAVEPAPAPPEPRPLDREPLPRIVAPLVAARADRRDLRGLIDAPPVDRPSAGAGDGGGAGQGAGRGIGPGRGAGVGPGSGGGTGGGPYRPGSGVTAPAIAHEVKPDYTVEALRRRIEGDVVLEVIVLADGSVGVVRVIESLGYGLDEAAVAAMRQWRFHPARRQGEPVDVVVEVAMAFRTR